MVLIHENQFFLYKETEYFNFAVRGSFLFFSPLLYSTIRRLLLGYIFVNRIFSNRVSSRVNELLHHYRLLGMKFRSPCTWLAACGMLACLGLVAAQTNRNGDNNDHDINGNSTVTKSTVHIDLTSHKPISMEISSDGVLASYEFKERLVYISASLVRGNEHAVCFLWRQETEDTIRTDTAQWVSVSFSAGKQLTKSFPGAQRLYCFDNSRDQADGNIYTLFVENYEGDRELVRVRVPEGKAFSELALVDKYPQFRVGPRASLVDTPGARQLYRNPYSDYPVCYLRPTGYQQSPLIYATSMILSHKCSPDVVIDGIICFRNYYDDDARKRFFREERLMGPGW